MSGPIENLIWHFVGYWHMAEESSASRLAYEDMVHRRAHEADRQLPPAEHAAHRAAEEMDSQGIRGPKLPQAQEADLHVPAPRHETHASPAPHLPAPHLEHPLPAAHHDQVAPTHPGYEAPGPTPVYEIHYEAGGTTLVDVVHQLNVATDVDHLLQNQTNAPTEMGGAEVQAELQGMQHEADAVVPTALDGLAAAPPADLLTAIAAHDAQMRQDAAGTQTGTEGGATTVLVPDTQPDHGWSALPGATVLQAGTTIDGVHQAAPVADTVAPSPEPALPEIARDGSAAAQLAETGGNTAMNLAADIDTSMATRTLVVQGDYYETNAIVQVNVLHDSDSVATAGGIVGSIETGGDAASNAASLTQQDLGIGSYTAHPYGLYVHVDTVEGDLVNITSTVQTNWIGDGDVVVQQNTSYVSYIEAGGNTQVNYALLDHGGSNYDLIVVAGDYHKANIIQQTNIVLDNDRVQVASDGTGSNASQTVSTGDNVLENHASIDHYGVATVDPLTGAMQDLAASLLRGEQLDLSAFENLPTGSMLHLSILVVKGDYWDIHSITQTNVIADTDHLVQVATTSGDTADGTLPALDAGTGGGTTATVLASLNPDGTSSISIPATGDMTQFASTGGNHAVNVAQIIDQGAAVQQMVGGAHYSDSVLIQAELITKSDDVQHGDPSSLVPELVAFTDHGLTDTLADHAQIQPAAAAAHADVLGGVLA